MASDLITVKDIKEKVSLIFREYPVNKAMLFGSFSTGSSTENSDIDLYIDTSGKLKGLDFVGLIEMLVSTLAMEVGLIDESHIEDGSAIMQKIEKEGMVIYEKSNNICPNA